MIQNLPTPTASDSTGSRVRRRDGTPYGNTVGRTLTDAVTSTDWGIYLPAIARWEPIVGRLAPDPRDAKGRLSPLFSEWMMGLPEGWVTALLGHAASLRVLGNGVMSLQASTALAELAADLPC